MSLSLLNTSEVQVVRLVKAMYNAAPGNVYLTNFTGYANSLGVNALATALGKNFAAVSNDSLAASVAANLGLTGDALAAGTAYLLGQFNVAGADRGVVILNAVNGLSGLTGDATYGAAATAFNDSVSTGLAYSTNSANTSTDLTVLQAASVPTGNTVAMVAGTDNLTGTARGDTFTGTMLTTLTDVDRVDGGAGADSLRVTLGASTATTTPLSVTNVETIRVTGSTAGTNSTLDVKNATGLTLLEFNDVTTTAAATHTIQGITSPSIGLQVANATATSTTLNFTHAAAGLTGAADTVALTLRDNGASTALVAAVQVNTAGIEGLNVTSSGSGNFITNLTATNDLKALTITGDAPLTVTTLGGAGSKLVNIDASAATGAINIDTSFAANIAVTGGAGNDTFVFAGNLDVNDTVDGGAGVNTVSVGAGDGNAVPTNVTLKNIQSLTLTAGADQLLSQANLASITSVTAQVPTNTITALTGGTAGAGKHSLTYVGAAADSQLTYALTANTTTTADQLSIRVGTASADGIDRGAITANEIETLNVTSVSRTASAANTVGLTATSANVVNLSGTALTLDATDFAAEHTINASAMTGALTIATSEASTDQTIIGGSANDSITFASAHLNSNDSVDGGAGNDTVTVGNNTTNAVAYGRVSLANVENLEMTFDVDSAVAAQTHSIDLRNAPVTAIKLTTVDGAGNANTDVVSVSNIQAATTRVNLHLTGADYAGGTVTLDSDRNTAGNLVLTGATGINLNGTTVATTGDWESFAIRQTGSASTDANVLTFTGETALRSLSVDASEQAMTFSSIGAARLANLTITGDNNVTVTALSQTTAALANIDASASTANVTLTATTRTAAATVTTGSGDDAIELTLGTEAGNTINAGSNSTLTASTGDTLNLNGTATGNTAIDLASTTDQITTINGVANAATQIGFEHVSAAGTSVAGGTFTILGTSGINVITGASGNDTIDGGAGNDVITGGGGVDVLTGAAGNDAFKISATAVANGIDLITDFQVGETAGSSDKIDVTAMAEFLGTTTVTVSTITDLGDAAQGAANTNVFLINVGTYANAAALLAAGITGAATRDFGATSVASGTAHALAAYISSVTGNVRIAEVTIADLGGFVDGSVTDLVELVGVTSVTGLLAANFITD